MADSNAVRFLTHDGDDTGNALTMFWGSVLEAFRAKTLLWNNIGGDAGVGESPGAGMVVSSKTIPAGQSHQFPIIGDDPTPEYHTPGTELLGQNVDIDQGTITIDDILVAHYDVPIDQLQLSHFDVLVPFGRKLGRALAIDFDKKLFITGVKAAQTAAVTGIHGGGNMVERVAATEAAAWPATQTGAANFRDDVAQLGQLLDEDNVPEDGRYLFINPYLRRVLVKDTTIFDSQLSRSMANSLNSRVIGEIEGFAVMPPTNHLPSTAITTGPSKYQIDATAAGSGEGKPSALCLCGAAEGSGAVGYVAASNERVGPIYAIAQPDERRNTLFMKAQMMVGAGVLAPWCAGTIHVDTA